jgi:hypothetical protein
MMAVEHNIRLSAVDFKRGYIRALFLEDERWINCIIKYWMIVPGRRLNKLDNRRDLALKEKLADQVHPDTYQQRKAYYDAWLNAKCCADDCGRYCDECHGIKFDPVPSCISKPFDPDVRRNIKKYQRYWLKSEQDKALKNMRGGVVHGDGREVFDQTDSNDVVWDGERKGFGRSCQREEDSSNPYQKQKESFLWPRPGRMAFEKSFEYWDQ